MQGYRHTLLILNSCYFYTAKNGYTNAPQKHFIHILLVLSTFSLEYLYINVKNTMVNQMVTVNMFYIVIYWTQKGTQWPHFLCSIVLPPVGHSSKHEYHCCQLTRQSSCVSNFYRTFKIFIWLSIIYFADHNTDVGLISEIVI